MSRLTQTNMLLAANACNIYYISWLLDAHNYKLLKHISFYIYLNFILLKTNGNIATQHRFSIGCWKRYTCISCPLTTLGINNYSFKLLISFKLANPHIAQQLSTTAFFLASSITAADLWLYKYVFSHIVPPPTDHL